MSIDRIQFTTDPAAGSAGSATATGYSEWVRGKVLAVHIKYEDSPPNTTDFTLSDEQDPASESIISLSDANTDVKIYPRRATETNGGADIEYDTDFPVHEPYVVHGRLEATIAGANAGDSVTVTVWLEC